MNGRNLALLVIFGAMAFGQVLRLPLLAGGRATLTAADLVIGLLGAGLFIALIYQRRLLEYLHFVWQATAWRYLLLFGLWALLSLLLALPGLAAGEALTALAYWLRLLGSIVLLTGLSFWLQAVQEKRLRSYFLLFGVLAIGAGFYQLFVLPDFRAMVEFGWDPHVGRLLSTFYDPNYFAALLVLIMTITVVLGLKNQAGRWQLLYGLIFLAAWVALYLTYSRSGWLMGFLAVPLASWLYSRRLSALLALIFVVAVLLPNRLSGRIWQSTSFLRPSTVTEEFGDPSAAARAIANEQAIRLFSDQPVTGVGYNAFGFVLTKAGYAEAERLEFRSGMGTDNSWLFILATTGVTGFILYGLFFTNLMQRLYQARHRGVLAWPLATYCGALIAGAFFNNLLFYVPLIIGFYGLVGWELRRGDD